MADEVVYLKGPGGVVWPFTLPLSPDIEKQLTRHELVRVDADGAPWVEPATGEPAAAKRPAKAATKAEWVGYAVSQGMTVDAADAATKDDLIAKYGSGE